MSDVELDESLEKMAEVDGHAVDEDDEEAALEELIRLMVHEPSDHVRYRSHVGFDEFTCRGCHFVQHRSRLTDFSRMLCRDCAGARTTRS